MSLHASLLPALGVFAAAARHQNFSHAAVELHLTASAVSHHVRRLESMLGVSLFQRHARGVLLTPEGRLLADAASAALGDVQSVFDALHRNRRAERVRISVLPSLAPTWLLPRLPGFLRAHPRVQVDIDTDRALSRFDASGPDLGVRYGPGHWPGTVARFLMDDALVPMTSPALAEGVDTPEQILDRPLITDVAPEGWREWFRAAGVHAPRVAGTHTISDSADGLAAAAAGVGVVLARRRLASAHLADGRLVRLPGPSLPARYAYYVVHAAHREPSAPAAAFIGWLEREARLDTDAPA